jgi:hypothetical protein
MAHRRRENERFTVNAEEHRMPKSSRQRETATSGCTLFFALATFLALCLDAASPVRAQPLLPCPNPADTKICTMTIKIFNNDPTHWFFPVLTTGKGPVDIWMQAWFSVTTGQLPATPTRGEKTTGSISIQAPASRQTQV